MLSAVTDSDVPPRPPPPRGAGDDDEPTESTAEFALSRVRAVSALLTRGEHRSAHELARALAADLHRRARPEPPDDPRAIVAGCPLAQRIRGCVCVARQLENDRAAPRSPGSSPAKRGAGHEHPSCVGCETGLAVREALGDEVARDVRRGNRSDWGEWE